jgi:anti-anti-sigma factor
MAKISRLGLSVQSHFRVEVLSEKGATILAVSGELDLASSPALEEELERASDAGVELLILDLRDLEFMDSTGLSVVLKASQRAQDGGQRFRLVKGSQQVQRLLNLTGVAERMTVVDSPEELLGGG